MNKKSKILHVSIFACIDVLMNLLDQVESNSEMSKEYKKQAQKLNDLNEDIVDKTFSKQNALAKGTFAGTCAKRVETTIRKAVNELKF